MVQCDAIKVNRIGTVVCIPLASNFKWGDAPGNVLLSARATGLPKDSVANLLLIIARDKQQLTERGGKIARRHLVLAGIDIILGRW